MAATESVKINTELVDKVRDLKKTTGIPVGKFFEQAAEEKIKLVEESLKPKEAQ